VANVHGTLDQLAILFKSSKKSDWKEKRRDVMVSYIRDVIQQQDEQAIRQHIAQYEEGLKKDIYSVKDDDLRIVMESARKFLTLKSEATEKLNSVLLRYESNLFVDHETLLTEFSEAILIAQQFRSLSPKLNFARSTLETLSYRRNISIAIQTAQTTGDTIQLESVISKGYPSTSNIEMPSSAMRKNYEDRSLYDEGKLVLSRVQRAKPIATRIQELTQLLDRSALEEEALAFSEYERAYTDCTFLIDIIQDARNLITNQRLAIDRVTRELKTSRSPSVLKRFTNDYNGVLSSHEISHVQQRWMNERCAELINMLNNAVNEDNDYRIESIITEGEKFLSEIVDDCDKKIELKNMIYSSKHGVQRKQKAADELRQSLTSPSKSIIEANIIRASTFPSLSPMVSEAKKRLVAMDKSEYFAQTLVDHVKIFTNSTNHGSLKGNAKKLRAVVESILNHDNADELLEGKLGLIVDDAIRHMENFEHEEHCRTLLIKAIASDDITLLQNAIDEAQDRESLKGMILQATISLNRKKKERDMRDELLNVIEHGDSSVISSAVDKAEKLGSQSLGDLVKRARTVHSEKQEAIAALERCIDSGTDIGTFIELTAQYRGTITENEIVALKRRWHERRRNQLIQAMKKAIDNKMDQDIVLNLIYDCEDEKQFAESNDRIRLDESIQAGRHWIKHRTAMIDRLKRAIQQQDEKQLADALQQTQLLKADPQIDQLRERAGSLVKQLLQHAQLADDLRDLVAKADIRGIESWIEIANRIKHVDAPKALNALAIISRQVPIRDRLLSSVESKDRKRVDSILSELLSEDEKSSVLSATIVAARRFALENDHALSQSQSLSDSNQIKQFIKSNRSVLHNRDIDSIWNRWRRYQIRSFTEKIQVAKSKEDDVEIVSLIDRYNSMSKDLLQGVVDHNAEDDRIEQLIAAESAFVMQKREVTQALQEAVRTRDAKQLESSVMRSKEFHSLTTLRQEAVSMFDQVRIENEMIQVLQDNLQLLRMVPMDEVPKNAETIRRYIKKAEPYALMNRTLQLLVNEARTMIQRREKENEIGKRLKDFIIAKDYAQLKHGDVLSECEKSGSVPQLVYQARDLMEKQEQVLIAARLFIRTATKIQLSYFLEEHSDVLSPFLCQSIERDWKNSTRRKWVDALDVAIDSRDISTVMSTMGLRQELIRETNIDPTIISESMTGQPPVYEDELDRAAKRASEFLAEQEGQKQQLRAAMTNKSIERLEDAIENYKAYDQLRTEAMTALQSFRKRDTVIAMLQQALPSRDIAVLRNALEQAINAASNDPDLFIGTELENLMELAKQTVETRLEEENLRSALLKAIREKDRIRLDQIMPRCEKIGTLQEQVQEAKSLLKLQKNALADFERLIATATDSSDLQWSRYEILPTYDLDTVRKRWYDHLEQIRSKYERQMITKKRSSINKTPEVDDFEYDEEEMRATVNLPVLNLAAAIQGMITDAIVYNGSPKSIQPQLEELEEERRKLEQERRQNGIPKEEQERILEEEQRKRDEKEREEQERKKREEKVKQEREEKERKERERVEKEKQEREEKERKEREEKERIEKEKVEKARLEQERIAKERLERYKAEKERKEREKREREEKEKAESERKEKEKVEKEKIEKETQEKREREERQKREAQEKKEREAKEKKEREERERKEKEEKERKEREAKEKREREEKEKKLREETERKKAEEKRIREENERKEKERKERETKEKREREEKERREREEKEEKEKKNREAREKKEREEKEQKEREEKERKEREAKEKREREEKERREREEKEEKQRIEREEQERIRKELEEREEHERQEKLRIEQERLEQERKERERIERERAEAERFKREEEERIRVEHEKAQLEQQRLLIEQVNDQEEKERLQREIEEKERRMKAEQEERMRIQEEENRKREAEEQIRREKEEEENRKRDAEERLRRQKEEEEKRKRELEDRLNQQKKEDEVRKRAMLEEERRTKALQLQEEEEESFRRSSVDSDSFNAPPSPTSPASSPAKRGPVARRKRNVFTSKIRKDKTHPLIDRMDQAVTQLIVKGSKGMFEEIESSDTGIDDTDDEDQSIPKERYRIKSGFDKIVVSICKLLSAVLAEGVVPPRLLIDNERTPYSIIKGLPAAQPIVSKYDALPIVKHFETDSFTKSLFFVGFMVVTGQSSTIIQELINNQQYLTDMYEPGDISIMRNTENRADLLYVLKKVEKVFEMSVNFETEQEKQWELIEELVGDTTHAQPLLQVRAIARIIIDMVRKELQSQLQPTRKGSDSPPLERTAGRKKSIVNSLINETPPKSRVSPPGSPRSPRSPRLTGEKSQTGESIEQVFKKKFCRALTLFLEDGFKSFKFFGRYYIWDAMEWTFKTPTNEDKDELRKAMDKIGKPVDDMGDKLKEPADVKFVLLLCDSANKGKLRKRLEILLKDQPTMDGFYSATAAVKDETKRNMVLGVLDALSKIRLPKIPLNIEDVEISIDL
jgi:hypothetical protein